jgi:hypothetical protein
VFKRLKLEEGNIVYLGYPVDVTWYLLLSISSDTCPQNPHPNFVKSLPSISSEDLLNGGSMHLITLDPISGIKI